MRSTLLFVAVLLACSPMHAQATAPEGAQISITWFAAIFPAPAAETTRRTIVKRRVAVRPAYARMTSGLLATAAVAMPPAPSSRVLLHDSNAP